MRRLGSIALNGLTVLSLVLALLVAMSWVRSYWRCDGITFVPSDGRTKYSIATSDARLQWLRGHADEPSGFLKTEPRFTYWSVDTHHSQRLTHTFTGLGWQLEPDPYGWAGYWTTVDIPHAYLLALFASRPAIRFYRQSRRRHLRIPGHCTQCGYDLRATPDRCPECGTAATPNAVAAEWKRARKTGQLQSRSAPRLQAGGADV